MMLRQPNAPHTIHQLFARLLVKEKNQNQLMEKVGSKVESGDRIASLQCRIPNEWLGKGKMLQVTGSLRVLSH